MRIAALAVALVACGGEDAPRAYHFDGHPLGVPLAEFLARPAYASACRDAEPGLRKLHGNDCFQRPGSAFPAGTSVAVVGETTANALVWFGGTYFATHSDFPVAVGASEGMVTEHLGPVEAAFDIVAGYSHFHARRHRGRVFSFVDRGVVIGYAVGALPDDPRAPLWQALLDLYSMSTPMPAPLEQIASGHDDCLVAFLRAYKLIHAGEMTGGPYNPALDRAFGDDIDDCQFNRTKPYLACLDAATTAGAVRTCMAGPTW